MPRRDGVCHRGRRAVRADRHQQEGRVQGSLQPQRLVKQSQEGSLDLFFFLTSGDKSPKREGPEQKKRLLAKNIKMCSGFNPRYLF